MLYCFGSNVYTVDGDGIAHPADLEAKEKVREVRELESVTVKPKAKKVELPTGAAPATLDELVARFNLNESNPVKFDEKAHKAAVASGQAPAEVEETAEQE